MRFLNRFRRSSAADAQLEELYRAAEAGQPLPEVDPEVLAAFESDRSLIERVAGSQSSAASESAAFAREALLSRVAQQAQGREIQEVTPMLAAIFRKRTLAIAGAAFLIIAVAATAGASGTVNHVNDGLNDVLGTLQTEDQVFGPAGATEEPEPTEGLEPTESPEATEETEPTEELEPTEAPEPTEDAPIDVQGSDPEDLIEVCHVPPGNPAAAHTIMIGEPALDTHLGHGDTEGACAGNGPTVPNGPPNGLGPQAQVEVCHVPPGNPNAAHTINISEAALETHLGHGDTEGACEDGVGPVGGPPEDIQQGGPPSGNQGGGPPFEVPRGGPNSGP